MLSMLRVGANFRNFAFQNCLRGALGIGAGISACPFLRLQKLTTWQPNTFRKICAQSDLRV